MLTHVVPSEWRSLRRWRSVSVTARSPRRCAISTVVSSRYRLRMRPSVASCAPRLRSSDGCAIGVSCAAHSVGGVFECGVEVEPSECFSCGLFEKAVPPVCSDEPIHRVDHLVGDDDVEAGQLRRTRDVSGQYEATPVRGAGTGVRSRNPLWRPSRWVQIPLLRVMDRAGRKQHRDDSVCECASPLGSWTGTAAPVSSECVRPTCGSFWWAEGSRGPCPIRSPSPRTGRAAPRRLRRTRRPRYLPRPRSRASRS